MIDLSTLADRSRSLNPYSHGPNPDRMHLLALAAWLILAAGLGLGIWWAS
jgi:hypothetical protein